MVPGIVIRHAKGKVKKQFVMSEEREQTLLITFMVFRCFHDSTKYLALVYFEPW